MHSTNKFSPTHQLTAWILKETTFPFRFRCFTLHAVSSIHCIYQLCGVTGWKNKKQAEIWLYHHSGPRSTGVHFLHSEHDPLPPSGQPATSALRQNPPTLDCFCSIRQSAHSLQDPFIRADHTTLWASQPARSLKNQGIHPELSPPPFIRTRTYSA